MPRKRKFLSLLVLLCHLVGTSVVLAAESRPATRWDAVGVRVGADLTDAQGSHLGHFRLYEAFTDYLLPWKWRNDSGLELRTRLDASAGLLERDGTSAFLTTAGPGLALGMFSDTVEIDAGLGGSFVSRHDFPGRNLGGLFLFNIRTGISAYLFQGLGIGYHYQHLSNAYLYAHNPGLNVHMLELKYRF
jgi:lipid A 3-O-deacylase